MVPRPSDLVKRIRKHVGILCQGPVPCHHNYLDDKQYQSIHTDCEELVKILVTRCKKMDQDLGQK